MPEKEEFLEKQEKTNMLQHLCSNQSIVSRTQS